MEFTPMISVVIPVFNKAETILSLIQCVVKSPVTPNIFVVDDGTIEDSPEIAVSAAVRVTQSFLLGEGASMEDGMHAAKSDVIFYLDGELSCLRPNLKGKRTAPTFEGRSHFVKAAFSRQVSCIGGGAARLHLRGTIWGLSLD